MENFFETPKKKIVIVSVAAILLIVLTIVTIGIFAAAKPPTADEMDDDFVGAFADMTEGEDTTTVPPESESKAPADDLLFESNGDGTCSVTGIGGYTDPDLIMPAESPDGDTVTEIGEFAFEGCEFIETVYLPSGLKKIEKGAFSGCTSLVSFTVDSTNTKFCAVGGVLFSRDKSVLVAYPAMKVGRSYLLSTNVQTIGAYAFEELTYLKTILYQGSTSKFQDITIERGNAAFDSLSVTCNYSPAK